MKNKIELNKKYRTISGSIVRIYAVDGGGDYPVHGSVMCENSDIFRIECWTSYGSYNLNNDDDALNLEEVSHFDMFRIDDLVEVWDYGYSNKTIGYFAGIDDRGKPMIFSYGTTSITAKGFGRKTISYENCRKYEGDK